MRELNLLQATLDNDILGKLEKNGVDLVLLEKLLPTIEELGVLETAGNLQQPLLNIAGFLLVEGAPFLIGPVAGALEVGPPAFFLAALATGGAEAFLVANGVEVPFVGLPAGVIAGLLLVPLTAVFAGAGVTLAGLKK